MIQSYISILTQNESNVQEKKRIMGSNGFLLARAADTPSSLKDTSDVLESHQDTTMKGLNIVLKRHQTFKDFARKGSNQKIQSSRMSQ